MKPDSARPICDIEVAEQCEFLVTQPDVAFEVAWALALAAQRIRERHCENQQLKDEVLRAKHKAEQLEGDNAHLFHLHYGPQQGGAA